MSHLLTDIRHHVAIATLNRPAALNALSLEMILDLKQILSAWMNNNEICSVIIRSNTTKAFCAGGDLRFFYQARVTRDASDQALLERFFDAEYALNHLIHRYPKPYLVFMDGIVMGGGMGIAQSSAASCVRIVTEHTRMAMPEVNIGLFPDVAGGYFLSRLPGKIGTWLALTGETISAVDALYAGLADTFIPGSALSALCTDLQDVETDHGRLVMQFSTPFQQRIQTSDCMLARHRTLIDQHFSADSVPDILASLSKDDHPFARKTVQAIMRRSPLMLCITLEQLRRARTMTLADCLRMERSIMQHCLSHGEMVEGIRAAIIDKDNLPRWQPATLEAVTPDMIARFFEPAWPEQAHPLRMLKG